MDLYKQFAILAIPVEDKSLIQIDLIIAVFTSFSFNLYIFRPLHIYICDFMKLVTQNGPFCHEDINY